MQTKHLTFAPTKIGMAILTFQYLRELQKKERDLPMLQQIDANFYTALAECAKASEDNEAVLSIARSIFDMRERKIMSLAIKSARAGIKPQNMLPEEEPLFLEACNAVKKYRESVEGLLEKEESAAQKEKVQSAEPPQKAPQDFLKVRALLDVPAFVGEDLKIYGPLKAGEIAEVPKKAAGVLVNAGSAEFQD